MDDFKQVIVVRSDLKMDKGKMSAQCCHASVESTLKSGKENICVWKDSHMKKVILKVKGLPELLKYKKLAEQAGLKTALITDAGRTVFNKPTITCLAIGPDEEKKIDAVTGDLQML